jgi:hypothetical protein
MNFLHYSNSKGSALNLMLSSKTTASKGSIQNLMWLSTARLC